VPRAEFALPDDALLLCAFHQPFKISAEVFDVWCGLLASRPDARLWLLDWNAGASQRLRDASRLRGIDPDRLLFAPRVPVAQHLRRLSCADVFLDTWPCNAHTTAGEALWVGVPVVSLQGEAFAQRVASSLLHALDLNELVCDRVDAYAAQVLALADDAPRRAALRERLLQPHTLFDGAPMARALEALWTRMWQRALAGRKPAALAAEAA
jgi:predicted O-linked N-acetylglucosamine transferase (SPINDLY family)